MLEMYYGVPCESWVEGERFVNERLKEIITDYVDQEVISYHDNEDEMRSLFTREDAPKTSKGFLKGNMDQIWKVGLMRKSQIFWDALSKRYELFPRARKVTPKRAAEIFFDLYQAIWSEHTYKPDWYSQYMLYEIMSWYRDMCKDVPEVFKWKKKLPKRLRDKLTEELKKEYGEPPCEECKDKDPEECADCKEEFSPDRTIAQLEDFRNYIDFLFEDLDFLELNSTSIKKLKKSGIADYTGMDFFGDIEDIKREQMLDKIAKGFVVLCVRENGTLEDIHSSKHPITDAVMKDFNIGVTDMVYTVLQYLLSEDKQKKKFMEQLLIAKSIENCGDWYDAVPVTRFEQFFDTSLEFYSKMKERAKKNETEAENPSAEGDDTNNG